MRLLSRPHPRCDAGDCVELHWHVQGDVLTGGLLRDGAALWDRAPALGSLLDCPAVAGTAPYRLEVAGPGGVAAAELLAQTAS